MKIEAQEKSAFLIKKRVVNKYHANIQHTFYTVASLTLLFV